MNEDRDLVLEQAERLGASTIMNLVDALNLEEMIARSQRAELIAPALVRAFRHRVRARYRQRAAFFDRFGIGLARVSLRDRPAQAGVEDVIHCAVVERDPPVGTSRWICVANPARCSRTSGNRALPASSRTPQLMS